MFENSGRNSGRIIYPTFHRNIQELLDEITHLENFDGKETLLKPFIKKRYNHQDEMLINLILINQIDKTFKNFFIFKKFSKNLNYSYKIYFKNVFRCINIVIINSLHVLL